MKHTLITSLNKSTTIVLFFAVYFSGCSSNDEPSPVDCSSSDLAISVVSKTNPTSCGSPEGQITVAGSGGKAGYMYSINNNAFQSNGVFSTLAPGTYSVKVKDELGCTKEETNIVLTSPDSPTATVSATNPDTSCETDNGSITVQSSGGIGEKQYSINGTTFQASNIFASIRAGNYTVTVKDEGECSVQVNATVPNETGISYTGNVLAVFQSNCLLSGCHLNNANGRGNWGIYAEAKDKAALIKSRTQAGTMPPGGGLPQAERDLIACWVDHGAPQN